LTPSLPGKISRNTRRLLSALSRKKIEYLSIFLEQGITKTLFNKILSKTHNYYKLENLQQRYMESKERKLCNNQPSSIKEKKN
jgi:hypothetical protein